MTVPRLVALDIDGTLLRFDQTMSEPVRDAVAAVYESGVHVVLATGRSLASLVPIAHDLGITRGYVVGSNGAATAKLRHPDQFDVLDLVTFDPGPALAALRAELPDAFVAVEENGMRFRVSAMFPGIELGGEVTVSSEAELAATLATRVVLYHPDATPEEFHAAVQRVGLHEVAYSVGWSAWLDLTPRGVNKASALDRIRQTLGVAVESTTAVGDGTNDLEMLRWAGRGVAMGQATTPVLDAADEVTGTVDEDGVVAVLQSLLV